jgi:hypothetical protein
MIQKVNFWVNPINKNFKIFQYLKLSFLSKTWKMMNNQKNKLWIRHVYFSIGMQILNIEIF